jgi:hypothetical protein
MSEPNGHAIVKEPYHLGAPQEKLLARSKANAERKKFKAEKGVQPPHLIPYTVKKGQPFTRPVNSRARLNAKFMAALVEDFESHGKRAIERMRIHDPSGYIKTVAFLMPKQFEQTTPMQDLTDDELERGIEFLKSKLALSHGEGIRAPTLIEQDSRVPAVPETD